MVIANSKPVKICYAIDRCIDMEREINSLIDRLIDLKMEVIRTIEQLPPIEYDVLHKRYIQNMTFDEVGDACGHKSKSWATTVHGRALQNVQKILDARAKERAEIERKRLEEVATIMRKAVESGKL